LVVEVDVSYSRGYTAYTMNQQRVRLWGGGVAREINKINKKQ
jgi:hypothetical protein